VRTLLADAERVLVQGITGAAGRRHAVNMRAYGTPIVAGVTPGRGDTEIDGIPVFDTVAEAVEATGATATVAFLPPSAAASGLIEAAEAGLRLAVCATEGVPVHDALVALDYARRAGMCVFGPNTAGLMVPGQLSLGFLPTNVAFPGPCAVLSKSGTLSYEVVLELTRVGVGQSAWIVVGGDSVKGSTFADVLPMVLSDPRAQALALVGEIGGTDEEDVAELLAATALPCVALMAGRTAPQGVAMGHAGAMISESRGSYGSKATALQAARVKIATSPATLARALAEALEPVPA